MKLLIATPLELILETEIKKVIAPTELGSFCLLPRHADGVWRLKTGILEFVDSEDHHLFAGINAGIVVKCADTVRVATHEAVISGTLTRLRHIMAEKFHRITDDERRAQSALARLEAGVIRRIVDLERQYG